MKTLNAPDTISGKEGRAYAKIDGNNEDLFFAKTIESTVESFILDYHGNLYNRQVRLEFYKFLRPERKFDSVDALKARILYDANTTRAYFEAQTQHA